MAPTPDTVGPIAQMSAESDNDNKADYINDGFVRDEMHNSDDSKLHSPQMPTAFQTMSIATVNGNEAPKFEKTTFKKTPSNSSMRQSITETIPPNLDFDDILPHIGQFGTYQKILFFLMIPFAFSVAFVYFSQIFLSLVPDRHWCHIHELIHLPIEQR